MNRLSYTIVTPARNEGSHIQRTIDSVLAQTIRPTLWVIVDDGSSDLTARIVDTAAKQNDWIKAIHQPDRGYRKPGGGVIDAFYEGYRQLSGQNWDFVVKLDADLRFERDYFERCLEHFTADPKLGIGGGVVCLKGKEGLREECSHPAFHVMGPAKMYRKQCWNDIGGLICDLGWDTLDEVKANMLGWRTYAFRELKLETLKGTGSADGPWNNWFKNGRASHVVGYSSPFLLLKAGQRLFQRPYGVTGVALLTGYLSGALLRIPRTDDELTIRYLRSQQLRRIFNLPTIWK